GASVDGLSGGRLIGGIGAGWNREEMRNHGTDPSKRFRVMRERVEAMKAIWAGEEAEYHGEFVDFDPIWQWPKPVQKPHPPVMVGGGGPGGVARGAAHRRGGGPPPDRDGRGARPPAPDRGARAAREPPPPATPRPPPHPGPHEPP